MRRLLGRTDDVLWSAFGVLFLLMVAVIILRAAARYTPSPIANAARTVGEWADPGNI